MCTSDDLINANGFLSLEKEMIHHLITGGGGGRLRWRWSHHAGSEREKSIKSHIFSLEKKIVNWKNLFTFSSSTQSKKPVKFFLAEFEALAEFIELTLMNYKTPVIMRTEDENLSELVCVYMAMRRSKMNNFVASRAVKASSIFISKIILNFIIVG
jgi:hypothetical protein